MPQGLMLVMFVVSVHMIMQHRLIRVFMLMALGQMQPGPHGHEPTGNDQRDHQGHPYQHRESGSKKRGHRKIGPGARRAQVTQPRDVKREADAIGQQPDG